MGAAAVDHSQQPPMFGRETGVGGVCGDGAERGYARYRKGRPDPVPAIAGEPEVAAGAGEVAEACGGGGSREGAVSVARAERRRIF